MTVVAIAIAAGAYAAISGGGGGDDSRQKGAPRPLEPGSKLDGEARKGRRRKHARKGGEDRARGHELLEPPRAGRGALRVLQPVQDRVAILAV